MHFFPKPLLFRSLLLLLPLLAGCGKDDEPVRPQASQATLGSPLSFPSVYLQTYRLEKVSGDHQFAFPGYPLAQPLRVRVLNQHDQPVPHVHVSFWGNGETLNSTHATDSAGYAQAGFMPTPSGAYPLTAQVQAQISVGDNTFIEVVGSPTFFDFHYNATATPGGGVNLSSSDLHLRGVFVDAGGNIYQSDPKNHRVQKWAPGATTPVTVAGGNGPGDIESQMLKPSGIFVDAAGNVYVADEQNRRVQKWAPGATSGETVAGGNGWGSILEMPTDVHLDAAGNLYVSDRARSVIRKFAPGDLNGQVVAGIIAGTTSHLLADPAGVFVDAAGNLYIADHYNRRVQKWAPGATSGETVAGGNGHGHALNQLAYPTDVWVDAEGAVYVADGSLTKKWLPGATSGIVVAGGGAGIFVDHSGILYVTERNTDRVLKWYP